MYYYQIVVYSRQKLHSMLGMCYSVVQLRCDSVRDACAAHAFIMLGIPDSIRKLQLDSVLELQRHSCRWSQNSKRPKKRQVPHGRSVIMPESCGRRSGLQC
jgi:hypothetical protein